MKMPSKRVSKATKPAKENECVVKSGKTNHGKSAKPRKALADKTNSASASDDNTSFTQNKVQDNKVKKLLLNTSTENDCRPRRKRKVPNRYKENVMLNSLSNIEETSPSKQFKPESKTKPRKDNHVQNKKVENKKVISPLKSPVKVVDSSLLQNRPKRISRLPNKFDDHCISPNKPIPVQPISTSTPLVDKAKLNTNKQSRITKNASQKTQSPKQNTIEKYLSNRAADTNNNAKQLQKSKVSPKKCPASPSKVNINTVRIQNKVLDKKNNFKHDSSKQDIYEFTFDPAEEPPPAKKKKKRPVTKKPSKPRTITIKSNYEKNLAKAMADLKNAVSIKLTTDKKVTNTVCMENHEIAKQKLDQSDYVCNDKNYNSVRVEDIALDIQEDNIDYSPVNSPRPTTPQKDGNSEKQDAFNVKDISFFDENPVASSSMNTSHPMASPWRANFEKLPIKWPVNSYVKPNMTPAFESSFINFDNKKKHVYTNIVETNEPDLVASPNLKQTSIMSFIKEVVDKSAKKKKSTPVKANSLFEDTNTSFANHTPCKEIELANVTPLKDTSNTSNISEKSIEHDMVDSKENDKALKNNTYFGFDQSEDQENISPKKKNKARLLRSRSRGILQELNVQKGPMRALIPVNTKSKDQDEVNNLFNNMKSANEPPELRNEPTSSQNLDKDESQSVHLFEDIEVVHHLKPTRKSYGKAKKVAFANSVDSDSPLSDLADLNPESSDEDESFQLPSMKLKKTVKKKKVDKQKLSKKEEKEVEAWAAGFNSMCEDIDEFDLLVE